MKSNFRGHINARYQQKKNKKLADVGGMLEKRTINLRQSDILNYRDALESAISKILPRRHNLHELYSRLYFDDFLQSCLNQLKNGVFEKNKAIYNSDGTVNEDLTNNLGQWYRDLEELIIDKRLKGYLVVQIVETLENGIPTKLELVDPRYVRPETHEFVTSISHASGSGIDYRSQDNSDWFVELGRTNELGLLASLSPQIIYRRQALTSMADYTDTFSLPMIVLQTNLSDDRRISDAIKMFSQKLRYAIVDEDDDIAIESVNITNPPYIFQIGAAERAIAQAVIGQTMTITDGSSLSQSEVHERVLESVLNSVISDIENIVNTQLLKKIENLGYPGAASCYIKYERAEVDDTAKFERIIALLNAGINVDPAYISDVLSIPILPPSPTPSA